MVQKQGTLAELKRRYQKEADEFVQKKTKELLALEKKIQEENSRHKKIIQDLNSQADVIRQKINQAKSIPQSFQFKLHPQLIGEIDPSQGKFTNAEEFIKEMNQQTKQAGLKFKMDIRAKDCCIKQVDFSVGTTDKFNLYAGIAQDIVGNSQKITTQDIFNNLKNNQAIQARGKNICHIIMQQGLRLKDCEHFMVFMKRVEASINGWGVFYVYRDADILNLDVTSNPSIIQGPDALWVFTFPKQFFQNS